MYCNAAIKYHDLTRFAAQLPSMYDYMVNM